MGCLKSRIDFLILNVGHQGLEPMGLKRIGRKRLTMLNTKRSEFCCYRQFGQSIIFINLFNYMEIEWDESWLSKQNSEIYKYILASLRK